LITGLVLGLLSVVAGLGAGMYYYIRLTRDLPQISRIGDYRPKGVTEIYSEDGALLAELYEEKRYPVSFEEIPLVVRNAFLAAEDSNFYEHPGIDVISIFRAVYTNLRHKGSKKQGASTITQQVVKSLLLTREKTYTRKAKEAILAYRLEKSLTKDEILTIYLNEIFLGQTAHGVRAAARVHFKKELNELTIAEAAYMAGLPQRPSYYARPANRKAAVTRQGYVLGQMLRNNMISRQEYDQAKDQNLDIFPPESNTFHQMPYFASHVAKVLEEKLAALSPGLTATNPGGFIVETTGNLEDYKLAEKSLRKGLREVDRRRGWRGPLETLEGKEATEEFLQNQGAGLEGALEPDKIYPAVVTGLKSGGKSVGVQVGEFEGTISLAKAKWASLNLIQNKKTGRERTRTIAPRRLMKRGSVVEVSLDPQAVRDEPYTDVEGKTPFVLDQTPQLQSAFSISNALTGEIKALIGGFDYEKSVFNRATQGKLQPGSAFKPFIYLAAVDSLGYTPATIVPDSPISMRDGTGDFWTPQNYDHKFLGPITLRTALQRSRNVVSVHLLRKVGLDRGIKYAKDLGITTKIDRNMSIALGTPEVKLVELVHSYSAFAGGGYLPELMVIKKVKDRDGNVILEQFPKHKQVIDEESAFIMANMMKGVVERGTAQILKKLERPVAGKTGTTNEQMDAWFVGYTPEWVAGAWVGFDRKKTIGRWETGGKAAAPIFLYFMQEFLKEEPELDFEIPDGVIPLKVNPYTGRLVSQNDPDGFLEYFKSGTEPTYSAADLQIPGDYLASDEF